ncbi:gamma-glutamylcyclotransferase family protein [Hoeflea marina]|uniref:gamma-glutamylcyclotransferase family protein n=1 Tax=Hoeflea marina TaxID=274592 RepID=UPI000D712CE1|nr:gamma-glutamylcyclotransferase family protein [Hoeflea marina]
MPADQPEPDLHALARTGDLIGYFGYGSLVNRATLRTEIVAAWPARLKGWRRYWRAQPDIGSTGVEDGPDGPRPSLLTAGRAQGAAIDGLLVFDRRLNLGAVDAREAHYHRREIAAEDLQLAPGLALPGCPLYVYEARAELPELPGGHAILGSYLDAVLQGFHREFGPDGVRRFIAETDEFHTPIHDDRHEPRYPRNVILSDEERLLFGTALTGGAETPISGT